MRCLHVAWAASRHTQLGLQPPGPQSQGPCAEVLSPPETAVVITGTRPPSLRAVPWLWPSDSWSSGTRPAPPVPALLSVHEATEYNKAIPLPGSVPSPALSHQNHAPSSPPRASSQMSVWGSLAQEVAGPVPLSRRQASAMALPGGPVLTAGAEPV